MVSAPEAVEELLNQTQHRQQVVNAVMQAVEDDTAFSLEVRSAFGATTSHHAEVLRQAIRHRDITRADLLACVDNGTALTSRLAARKVSVPLRFETLLDAVGDAPPGTPELGWDAAVEVHGAQGRFTLMVSNGYELWRAANFHTQEPETVAWLDDTFHEGDCLYDIGANIGLYTLYALAKTRHAHAVCFEPDAVNYYRLSMNVVANGFGPRAVVFPVALSDSTGLAAFNSSLFVAGKAENWLSPGAELFGPASPPNPWQREPRLRTGCPTFHLDGFLAQAPFLPAPTHLKIDVDSVEVAILRGAAHTLRNPQVRHVLVELYARELEPARTILAAAGLQHVRSVPQRNVLPCYEEFLGNHIFARSAT
jgi:FkbM family methyltransferase